MEGHTTSMSENGKNEHGGRAAPDRTGHSGYPALNAVARGAARPSRFDRRRRSDGCDAISRFIRCEGHFKGGKREETRGHAEALRRR